MHDRGPVVSRHFALHGGRHARDPFRRFLERQMDRRERQVEEKRGCAERLNPLDGFGGDEVGDVPRLLDKRFIAMPGAAKLTLLVTMTPRTHPAGERTVAMIEAKVVGPLFRQRAEMPLTDQRRSVPHRLERPRERDGVPPIRALVLRSGHSETRRIAATQQRRARRTANRIDVMLRQFHPGSGEPVEVRRRHVASMKRHVRPTEIVSQNKNDVWPDWR